MRSNRLLGNAVGSVAILAVLAGVAIGLPMWDRSLPASRDLPAGQPYPVGAGVTVVPPPDAVLDVTKTRPGPTRGSALFLIGAIRYAVVVEPFTGSLTDAAGRLRTQITSNRGYQVAGADTPVTSTAGVRGLQGGYTTPGRDGWYTVYLHGDIVVNVTVSGTEPALRDSLAVLLASVRTVAFPGGS